MRYALGYTLGNRQLFYGSHRRPVFNKLNYPRLEGEGFLKHVDFKSTPPLISSS
jgi:hypothetical protein